MIPKRNKRRKVGGGVGWEQSSCRAPNGPGWWGVSRGPQEPLGIGLSGPLTGAVAPPQLIQDYLTTLYPASPQFQPFPRGPVWETLGTAHLMHRPELFWGGNKSQQ